MDNEALSSVKAALQIDKEDPQGFFSDKVIAHYTLTVSNPFKESGVKCSVSVKSFYYVDLTRGGGRRAKKIVSQRTHDNIFVSAGSSTKEKGRIMFLDKGSLGGRMWIETNKWHNGKQLDFPGGVRIESCVFIH